MKEARSYSSWFSCQPHSVPAARQLVEEFLPGVSHECLALLKLLVSELATLAVLGGQSEFLVHLDYNENRFVRVEVIDDGLGEPVITRPHDERGAGLRVVEQLATDWGWEPSQGGHGIWCLFDLRGCESTVS